MTFRLRHLLAALALHLALLAVLAGGVQCSVKPVKPPVITGVLLDPSRQETARRKREEQRRAEAERKRREDEAKRQAEAGIQTITFDAATSKAYVEKSKEIGWANAIKQSPKYGEALKKVLAK